MVEVLRIRTFKSRFWRGAYSPKTRTIYLNEKLTESEKVETLKHELAHHHFYTQTALGRFLRQFRYKRVLIPYALTLLNAWLFFPIAYLPLTIPIILEFLHECITNLKHGFSWLSFSFAFSMLWLTLWTFTIRTL
ncbi:MAG: hypothetical protein QXJ53_03475 [Candidatus Bathyarchaeia archaeon]